MEGATKLERPIIFYDGDCGICSRFVQRMLKIDKRGEFLFAPIQGETAAKYLSERPADPKEWSIIMIDEQGTYEASTAVLRIMKRVGWGFGLPALGLVVPRPIRDWAYNLVSRNRYRLAKQPIACPLPSPAVRMRMLP